MTLAEEALFWELSMLLRRGPLRRVEIRDLAQPAAVPVVATVPDARVTVGGSSRTLPAAMALAPDGAPFVVEGRDLPFVAVCTPETETYWVCTMDPDAQDVSVLVPVFVARGEKPSCSKKLSFFFDTKEQNQAQPCFSLVSDTKASEETNTTLVSDTKEISPESIETSTTLILDTKESSPASEETNTCSNQDNIENEPQDINPSATHPKAPEQPPQPANKEKARSPALRGKKARGGRELNSIVDLISFAPSPSQTPQPNPLYDASTRNMGQLADAQPSGPIASGGQNQ